MQNNPTQVRMAQTTILVAFAALPLLLYFLIGRSMPAGEGGSQLLPIVFAAMGLCSALYMVLNRLGPDQSVAKFQQNMVATLAMGEMCSLMGIFLGIPAGLSALPFLVLNYVVLVCVFLRMSTFWANQPR
jgi:hypothetical protein